MYCMDPSVPNVRLLAQAMLLVGNFFFLTKISLPACFEGLRAHFHSSVFYVNSFVLGTADDWCVYIFQREFRNLKDECCDLQGCECLSHLSCH